MDSVHLYDKRDLAMISIFRRDGQLFQMFHAALCRGIRKKTDPPYRIRCQCTSLYFRQVFLSPVLHIKIESGIAVRILGSYHIIFHAHELLLHQFIRCEAVNIDPLQPGFIYGNQIKCCFPMRIRNFLKCDPRIWHQQFLQAAGIFYVHLLCFPIGQDFGDKTVYPANEYAGYRILIMDHRFWFDHCRSFPGISIRIKE